MAKFQTKDFRNIVLCGHGGSGKTMLADAMLFHAKVLTRVGSIQDGTTASDFEPEEKAHQHSVSTAVLKMEYKSEFFNIIDTPGRIDFYGGQVAGLAAGDIAVICVNALKGVELGTRKAWDMAEKEHKARVMVVTHLDASERGFDEIVEQLQKNLDERCQPFVVVDGSRIVRALATDAPEDLKELCAEAAMSIKENAVEADDAMMEKYLEEGDISRDELLSVLKVAIAGGSIVPVFAVSPTTGAGVAQFLDALAEWAPSPLEVRFVALRKSGNDVVEEMTIPDSSAPLLGQVFKVTNDQHIGKLSHIRLWNGTLTGKCSFTVQASGVTEKITHLYSFSGANHTELSDSVAGDIVTVAKVEHLMTGDIIVGNNTAITVPAIEFPRPMVGLAVTPKSRNDEQKISTALHRLAEEDPTFTAATDPQTHELVIHGMGGIHLDVMLSKLKNRYKIEVDSKPPKIPYLETILGKAEGHHRHKKQTGGAGQFAEVYIRVFPTERGKGFEFINSIVGGAICAQYVGSTEKGVRSALPKGPLAGFPVVDVAVEVYDGKEHPVDSKDIAFQTAGKFAFIEAMQKARPALLEPIVSLEVVFPSAYTGDISADISGRRGRPTGLDTIGGMQVFKAEVPLAELADYGSALKAITQGEGAFSMQLARYEPVPASIAGAVVARLQAEMGPVDHHANE